MNWKKGLRSKTSAVDSGGSLQQTLISGLSFRPCRPVCHEDGVLTEITRESWPEINEPIVQTHVTTTLPGRVRAWGLHEFSTDRLFVVKGLVSIVVYDPRPDSLTFGKINEFMVSERNPGLLTISPNLFHGWKVIGTDEAFVINMPTRQYQYAKPDALDLPYESKEAEEMVPWRW